MTTFAPPSALQSAPPTLRAPSDTEIAQLQAQVELVRLALIRLDEVDLDVEATEKAFYAHHEALFAKQRIAKESVDAAEAALRVMLTALYRETRMKKVVPGAEVAVGEVYEYDRAVADAWTAERGICRKPEQFDAEAFEKLIRSGAAQVDFVRKLEAPKVKIASDIGAALSKARAGAKVAAAAVVGCLALVAAGCGRTPTAPAPCPPGRVPRIDTVWATPSTTDTTRAILAIVHHCPPAPR